MRDTNKKCLFKMVGIAKVKALDLKSLEEYFEYIIESKVNGQKKQAKELFEDLSEAQRDSFYSYVSWLNGAEECFEMMAYLR
jgi:hypothetical protein